MGENRLTMKSPRFLALALTAATALVPTTATAREQVDATGLTAVARIPYQGGTDLDFLGKYVYAGQEGNEGGVRIIDVSGAKARQVGFFRCPGNQNDVAVVRRGLIAIAYHSSQCGPQEEHGVRLVNVRNPKRPRILGSVELPEGTHTVTKYPGKPILYASPGGLLNSDGIEQILDISNPRKPAVAATYTPNPAGCHDISWYFDDDEKLAFCPGLSGLDIWDVTDPLAPALISHTANPFMDFMHYALPTADGNHLVVSDENFEAHECASGQSPTGSLYVYDISAREAPLLVGKFGPPRGAAPAGGAATPVCTSHNFNWIPGTQNLVVSWYTGGTNVIDLSDPMAPVEIAHYAPADANTWSSYFYRGRIYVNDLNRGLEVLKLDLPE